MRRLIFIQLLAYSAVLCAQGLSADLPPAKMSSTTKSSSEIQGMGQYERPKAAPSEQKAVLPAPVKPPPEVPQHADYLHPGILVNLNGTWEGSDHLLNLSSNIGVYVKMIKPEEEALDISEKELQKEVQSIFADAAIKPLTMAAVGKPPLPAFEIEVFVYPIEKGYAAFVEGRLFESVGSREIQNGSQHGLSGDYLGKAKPDRQSEGEIAGAADKNRSGDCGSICHPVPGL